MEEKVKTLVEELVEEIKNAKTKEEVEVLEKKAKAVERLIEAYEGDKDLDKIAMLMDKVGPMMEDILGSLQKMLSDLYSPEKMQAIGKTVAQFYKDLIEAGMDKETATELTKEYMKSINFLRTLLESFMNMMQKKGGFMPQIPKREKHEEGEEE
ncbi:hypothetical protein PNA2_1473 [Pyrococcus sp. NA2]|uniref:hypothetical protein n=1 Tax=Pyrococcus sp. (strain NA2) TaxID=342949 RepID=UPI000209AFA0|nr:hypothetical protein [Pyrococcus sp. NA2]AEC52388.1 hypothetical protein PNA2_1473 [Pyrococcus sp. NA2]